MARLSILGAIGSVVILLGLASTAGAANPASLLLPQSTAFSILGHSCGGIQEQAFATGFDAVSGYPTGDVYLQTRCSTGGRGSQPKTYSAWAAVTWNWAGAVSSYAGLASAPTGLSPTFSATDAAGNQVYNVLTAVNVQPSACSVGNTTYCTYRAYLAVVVPAAPTGVTAVQAGDAFQVGWAPAPATAGMVTSSTVTATPVASTAPVLTATVTGSATSALVGPLQPSTTYAITVVNTDLGGSSPASSPVTALSEAATVAPSAPTGVKAVWTAPDTPGDTLRATWAAAYPGNSPIDQYEITVAVHDGAGSGPFTQSVSGSTLSAVFAVVDTLDWSVTVRAHNAAGWGPWSAAIVLLASG